MKITNKKTRRTTAVAKFLPKPDQAFRLSILSLLITTCLLTVPVASAGDLILNDISNWNYIDGHGFNMGDDRYINPVPGLFESTGTGIRIATDSYRGGGQIMTKQAYLLAGTRLDYTWSGNGGGAYSQVVMGQLTTEWLNDPEAQATNCVNASYGNSFAGSWVAQPNHQYKTSVTISATSYQSTTVDMTSGAVMENSSGNFDFTIPLRILFRQNDTYDYQNAYLVLSEMRIVPPPASNYEPYIFTTFAGIPPGSTDGTGSAARFNEPTDAAVDASGNIYVVDNYNHTIRKITSAGVVTTFAGSPGNTGSADGLGSNARFNNPQGICIDSIGNLYVGDTSSNTIRKITPDANVTTIAGLAGSSGSADGTGSNARFNGPRGLAVNGDGNVYVTDSDNDTIRKISPAGVVSTLAGLAGSRGSSDGTGTAARFNRPRRLTLDSIGNVYVSDTYNYTIRKVTSDGIVSTIAGLAGNFGSDDGTGSAARFNQPRGITIDNTGTLYVADSANNTIRKIAPDFYVSTIAGSATSLPGSNDGNTINARFNFPIGLAIDGDGTLFVVEDNNCTVRKVTSAGVVSTLAGYASPGVEDGPAPSARFNQPYSVAVDAASNVYVADTGNQTIRKITAAGVVSTIAGLAGNDGSSDGTGTESRFNYPYAIAADSGGNVYVADTNNDTIRKITPSGTVTTLVGLAGNCSSNDGSGNNAGLCNPAGVAVDSSGNVYVADSANDTIRKITPAGVVTTLAGLAYNPGSNDGTGSDARFDYPQGVAVDSSGNVYVADSNNSTVRKITSGGVVTTLAGLAYNQGSNDGTGSDARFNYPQGVAADSNGNVYVADTLNDTIRKITAAGVVTTLAGVSDNLGSAEGSGNQARFNLPAGVAIDKLGKLYVADTANNAVRVGIPGMRVLNVSPNPVPAFNGQQAFTVFGNNFDANCSVTLRQISTGQVFANRTKYSQTSSSIVLKPNFTTTVSQWTVEVINSDGSSSGQFPFNVSSAKISSLSLFGPSTVTPGGSATYSVQATYSDGTTGDVTNSCRLKFSGAAPSFAGIGGTTLFINSAATATRVSLVAVYSDVTGQVLSPTYTVSITPTFVVSMTASAQYINATNYTITLHGSALGGSAPYTFRWDTNNDGAYGEVSGSNASYTFSSLGGTYMIGLEITDSTGAKAYVSQRLEINKPNVPGEPPDQHIPPDPAPPGFFAVDGTHNNILDPNKKINGFLVITHGIDDNIDGWAKQLGQTIQRKLGNRSPNILLYDWRQDAQLLSPSELQHAQNEISNTAVFAPAWVSIWAGPLVADLLAIIPDKIADGIESRWNKGPANGRRLADWISSQILANPQTIDPRKPIHLIGHSAGGFVMGECAERLKARDVLVDLVTMLDTPAPIADHINSQKNPAYVERYESSFFGVLEIAPPVPPIGDGNHYLIDVEFDTSTGNLLDIFSSGDMGHGYSHVWYTQSIDSIWSSGFNRSPFVSSLTHLDKSSANKSNKLLRSSDRSRPAPMDASSPPDQPISGFNQFGNVTMTSGGFLLTENSDTGLTQTIAVPTGAVSLKFRYKFNSPGDGDFLSVTWGSLPAIYVGEDLALSESGFVDAEIPLDFLINLNGVLTFTLVSRGSPNAAVDIEDIRFGMSDDVDGDGLSNEQEAALGTDPRKADTDGDGISDGDEVNIYHTNPLLIDSDGDGMSDSAEIAAGTDPNDGASILKIISMQRAPGGGFTITWNGNPTATYSVLRSADPTFSNYDVIVSGIPGNAATYTDTSIAPGAKSMFYKVRLDQ